jgi:hypothetical protein
MKVSRPLRLVLAGMALAVTASAEAGLHDNSNLVFTPSNASGGASQSTAAAVDLGSISGNLYSNDSLGMTYEFPKGWFVDRAWIDVQNKPVDPGPRPTDPDEAAKYDAMVAMRKDTHALLAVSEKPVDAAKGSGARIQLSVSPVFENKSGAEILNGMKSAYAPMRLVQIAVDPMDVTFGGQAFSRMDMRFLDLILRGGAGFQSAIIGVRNGRYLQFVILANSPEQLDFLVHSLDSLRFK